MAPSHEDTSIESLLPTHILDAIDDHRYFDEHPRYGGTRLQPSAVPFRPTRVRGLSRLPRGALLPMPSPIARGPMHTYERTSRFSLEGSTRPLREMSSLGPGLTLPEDLYEETIVRPAHNAAQLCGELMKFVTPSGPRLNGEGTQELSQGITHTLAISDRVILVQMTLLVAGFIIGPSGESVRMIMAKSGADIYSYSECILGRKCRVFYIEGDIENMRGAIDVMTAAVVRYKDLAEGKYHGIEVDKRQLIGGIEFFYQPPPKNVVPFAASLRVERCYGTKRPRSRNVSLDISGC